MIEKIDVLPCLIIPWSYTIKFIFDQLQQNFLVSIILVLIKFLYIIYFSPRYNVEGIWGL